MYTTSLKCHINLQACLYSDDAVQHCVLIFTTDALNILGNLGKVQAVSTRNWTNLSIVQIFQFAKDDVFLSGLQNIIPALITNNELNPLFCY